MFKVRKPIYGSNYYPEAWPREEIDKDLDMMLEMGMNCVRIAEFAWSTMEREEGKYDFSLFHEVVQKCRERNIAVIMGTPSACPPRWLSEKYPDMYYTTVGGAKPAHGGRRSCCPNHQGYLDAIKKIVEKMAIEFKDYDNIIGWQIDNEIEPERHGGRGCCCPTCEKKFREFMKEQFNGDIDALNKEWGNYIFSNNYQNFDQLARPNAITWTHASYWHYWGLFQNKSQLDFIKMQYDILKKYYSCPIGHDSMPIYNLDYDRLSNDMDIMQLNEYFWTDHFWEIGFWYDMMRGLKQKPFWLTETAPCWNGSAEANFMRPKNFNRANIWFAVSKGAELCNYWLWRAHKGGHELMHGSVVSSALRPLHIGDEIKEISAQFDKVGEVLEKSFVKKPSIAIHSSFTAYQMYRSQKISPGFEYRREMMYTAYRPLVERKLAVDIVTPSKSVDDYKVVFTPFMLNLDEADLINRMLEFVKKGGVWLVGPMSDIRNKSGAKFTDRAMQYLEEITGNRLDYFVTKGEERTVKFKCGKVGALCDIQHDVFTVSKDSTVLATYETGEYIEGKNAIVETPYGEGKIILMGTLPSGDDFADFMTFIAEREGVKPITSGDKSVYITERDGVPGFIAVEMANEKSSIVAPYDFTDLLSDKKYREGDTVEVDAYGVIFAKKE